MCSLMVLSSSSVVSADRVHGDFTEDNHLKYIVFLFQKKKLSDESIFHNLSNVVPLIPCLLEEIIVSKLVTALDL